MLPCRDGSHASTHGASRWRTAAFVAVLAARGVQAQEIRGLARLDAGGDGVWGANVLLVDSLGREAARTSTNHRGEFTVHAPAPGTYFLQLSARTVGRTASPVFVLDSGSTLHYEHVFRKSLRERVSGEDYSAQSILQGQLGDSSAGTITRGVGSARAPQVQVRVLRANGEIPIANAELALVAIDSRIEQVVGSSTSDSGRAGFLQLQPTWYRVVARHIGYSPGGTVSFPIMGDADSVSVVLRLEPVVLLDAVTVMERRITALGFNPSLMRRFFLGGDDLLARNPAARSIDDLITSLRLPGLAISSGPIVSVLRYRGNKVNVFILDGSRTSGDMPMVEPSAVESLMFIPPSEAGAVFGADALGGVLIINTRRK